MIMYCNPYIILISQNYIFDPFCPKLFHNQNNDSSLAHQINDGTDCMVCKTINSCGLKPPDNSNKKNAQTIYILKEGGGGEVVKTILKFPKTAN